MQAAQAEEEEQEEEQAPIEEAAEVMHEEPVADV